MISEANLFAVMLSFAGVRGKAALSSINHVYYEACCGMGCMIIGRIRKAGVALALLACSSGAWSQVVAEEESQLSLRGFGTLGAARSSNPNASYVRDLSQPKGLGPNVSLQNDSLLGLQANYRVNDRVEAVVQGVTHYRYDSSFAPEMTWAFVKYAPAPDDVIRVGRFATEFFMLADSRMVGYSYLPVRPPVDFYGNLPVNYLDGLDGQLTTRLDAGLVRSKLYAGVAREKIPANGQTLDLNGSRIVGASLDFQRDHWLSRLTYTRLRFQNHSDPGNLAAPLIAAGASAAAQALELEGSVAAYRAFGILYDDGTLQAQLAVNLTSYDSAVFENSRSGYFVAGYRVGQVTPFLGYSWSRSSAKVLSTGLAGPASVLDTYVASVMAAAHRDQHTATLGVRWDFARNFDLKAQLDRVRGTPTSVGLVHNVTPAWNGCTDVLSVALDFMF